VTGCSAHPSQSREGIFAVAENRVPAKVNLEDSVAFALNFDLKVLVCALGVIRISTVNSKPTNICQKA